MTKQDLYNALKEDGAKLKAINFIKKEELEQIYEERFGKKPDEPQYECEEVPNSHLLHENDDEPQEPKSAEVHALKFAESGWCNELGKSYFRGVYRPLNFEEYAILRKYASGEF